MRTLKIQDNWEDWKFGDTDAVMTFEVLSDNQVPDFTNHTLTFKIASASVDDKENPKDFLAVAAGYVQDKNVILKTEDVKQLTPGNYIVELWSMDNETKQTAIYPSQGFAQFTIEKNTMSVSDVTNIPTMSLNAFWDELFSKFSKITQGAKGDPGVTPKLVMGTVTQLAYGQQPSASLVATANDPNTYTLNLQIPQGADGKQGPQGVPGVGSKGLDGTNGLTPSIDPQTKHWMIGNTDTGIVAEGQPGKDADTSQLVTLVSFNSLRQEVKNNSDALTALQDSTSVNDLQKEIDGLNNKLADYEQVKSDAADNKEKLAKLEATIKDLQVDKSDTPASDKPSSDTPASDQPSSGEPAKSDDNKSDTPSSSADPASSSSTASSASDTPANSASDDNSSEASSTAEPATSTAD